MFGLRKSFSGMVNSAQVWTKKAQKNVGERFGLKVAPRTGEQDPMLGELYKNLVDMERTLKEINKGALKFADTVVHNACAVQAQLSSTVVSFAGNETELGFQAAGYATQLCGTGEGGDGEGGEGGEGGGGGDGAEANGGGGGDGQQPQEELIYYGARVAGSRSSGR